MLCTSSKINRLDRIEQEKGQSIRSYVFDVLGRLEPQEYVEFLFADDMTVIRNYTSTFGSNKGRKFRAEAKDGYLVVTRHK